MECLSVCLSTQAMELPDLDSIGLAKFSFDDMVLTDDQTVLASVSMFEDCGFIGKFHMDLKVIIMY